MLGYILVDVALTHFFAKFPVQKISAVSLADEAASLNS